MKKVNDGCCPLRPARWASRFRGLTGRGIVVLFAVGSLLGCIPGVEVLQPATSMPLATVAPEEHALAIIGVDFDPPLDHAQVLANGGVTLLVAIENRGLADEAEVKLAVRLLDGAAGQGDRVLLNERVTLKELVAGEVRILPFTQVSQLPQRNSYELVVALDPVPGERDIADNYRTYDILIHAGE